MDKLRRIISFCLTLVILLGMVITPSPINAATVNNKINEVSYRIVDENGKQYKECRLTDLVDINFATKVKKNSQFKNTIRTRAVGDLIPDADNYQVRVNWTAWSMSPDKLGPDVYFVIYDTVSKKTIAKTDMITGSGLYKFKETDDWGAPGVSTDRKKWRVRWLNEVRFDIRLITASGSATAPAVFQADVTQRAMTLYRAEYYTNSSKPTLTVYRRNLKDEVKEVDINKDNIGESQYYSFIEKPARVYYEGKTIDIIHPGSETEDSYSCNDLNASQLAQIYTKVPGKTDYDRGPGQFTDNGTPYHYLVTGDYEHPHIVTVRQELKVKFDPNGATFDPAVKTEQAIGHSMKVGEKFGDLEQVVVPAADKIKNIPKFKDTENNKEIEQKFIGWTLNKTTGADFKDKTEEEIKNLLVDFTTYEVKDNVTFYAAYAPVPQGKVAIQYVDKSGTAIKDDYKVQGVDYPKFAEGNKDENVDAKSIPQPAFIGYERNGDIVVTGKKYDENGRYTVEVPYKKLDSIIPEKKNGNDNPDATTDVKKHYAKVTYQVDTKDAEKAKLQLNGTDATSPLVYYVNPVEGIAIKDVANVNAVSKDANLYNVVANDMWTYDPNTITGTDYKIVQAKDTQNKVVKTEITLTAKVADKTAVKFKDKLDPETIKVWVGDDIDWKKGVKVKDDAENKAQLVADLKTELAKSNAKVEDLGENGSIAEPKTARKSDAQNLPDGKKGNLRVTFDDGSTLVVNEQMLYVSPLKVPVKPGEENQIDPDKLPKDKLAVEFKLGEGVKIGNKEGTTTPVLYETYYVKPNTSLESGDIPTTEVLNNNYKNNNWYNGNNVLAEADYTNITTDKTFVAKATPKGQGSAVVEYHVGNENITTKIADFKIDGQNYPANNKLTGAEDSVIDTSKITQPDLIGYKKVNITTEPATDAKYTEAGTAKVIFNYEKIDDIIGPVNPGDKIPTGYVTVAFKAATGAELDPGETSYFVNPKAEIKAKISKVGENYQISGKKADGTDLTGNVPVVNSTDKNKFEIQYADGEAKKWGYDNFNKVGQDLTTDTTFTAQVIKLGEPTVTFPPVEIEKGGSKEVTPEVKDKHGNKVDKPGKPEITKTPDGITVTPNNDGTVKIEVPKDYNGPGEITIKVKYKIGDKEVPGEINVKVKDDKKPEPKPEPQPVPEVEIPGIKIRDHYTPTYPVYVSVPDNGTKVIDTLWYIFHIDKYDYEEVRNNNSTSHKMDVTPVIRNDRTMLPLRYVAEAIGADVKWDPETRTATFTKDGLIATIQIDSDEIVLSNGKTVKMDSKPLNINDRILVSVVNVGNVFGLTNGNTLDGVDQDIEWDHDTRTATIYIRR